MTRPRRGLTRRGVLAAGGAAAVAPLVPPWAWAAGRTGLHGLSVFGDLKYPADFEHFAYVDPAAPKGGRINFAPPYWLYNQSTQTFNTLNSFVLKGDAPPRMEICFDTLMTSAGDEADAMYGLLADSVDVSDDGNVFTFHLRSGPRFHDGTPLSAEDVAFSLMLLKDKGHPGIAQPLAPMVGAEATDAGDVVVTLDSRKTRFTILTVAGLPILSRAYYAERTFDSSSLDAPLASGPYKVGRQSAGRFIEYERVAGYWGAELAVNVGQYNFDKIRIDFFREREAEFEAFKKGEITHREEATSLVWATGYDFPAVAEGKVKKSTEFATEARPQIYGMFFNARRATFRDPRTRLGLALAFDFEWTNKNLFFDSYVRLTSYFENSDFKAEGPPGADELALLAPHRDELPAEVFAAAYVPTKSNGSGRDRTMLKRAADLFAEAGWERRGSQLVDAKGAPLTVEFLIDAQIFERVLTPYVENLRLVGVTATLRQVDPAQYQARLNDFDFDMILAAFKLSATPLDGPKEFFGSAAADTPGGYNLSGIKEPVIDALLDRMPTIDSRAELIAVTRAIDRILRVRQYWVPGWFLPNHRLAYWDIFGWPAEKPDYAFTPETTWWFDRDKAAAIGYSG